MLTKSRYFDIIREDVFTKEGDLKLKNYVEEFQPYAVTTQQKAYANYGEIKLLDFCMKTKKSDRQFHLKYLQAKEAIVQVILEAEPIFETEVSELTGYHRIPKILRNLTYGDSELTVWVVEGYTYVLVHTGIGESACNLLFFCRIEEPKKGSH